MNNEMTRTLDPARQGAGKMIYEFALHNNLHHRREALLCGFINEMDYRFALYKTLERWQERLDGLAQDEGSGGPAECERAAGSQDVLPGPAGEPQVREVPARAKRKRRPAGAGGDAALPALGVYPRPAQDQD